MKSCLLLTAVILTMAIAAVAADLEMKPVESSFLDKVGYDPETRTLAIQMKNSSDIYTYSDVPAAVYEGLLEADSKGGYFVQQIKGRYPCTRK